MGLVGSGTNNARLGALLRNLAQFYHKDPHDLFMVRLAQVGAQTDRQTDRRSSLMLLFFHRVSFILERAH